jgi:hypothetical protein
MKNVQGNYRSVNNLIKYKINKTLDFSEFKIYKKRKNFLKRRWNEMEIVVKEKGKGELEELRRIKLNILSLTSGEIVAALREIGFEISLELKEISTPEKIAEMFNTVPSLLPTVEIVKLERYDAIAEVITPTAIVKDPLLLLTLSEGSSAFEELEGIILDRLKKQIVHIHLFEAPLKDIVAILFGEEKMNPKNITNLEEVKVFVEKLKENIDSTVEEFISSLIRARYR